MCLTDDAHFLCVVCSLRHSVSVSEVTYDALSEWDPVSGKVRPLPLLGAFSVPSYAPSNQRTV